MHPVIREAVMICLLAVLPAAATSLWHPDSPSLSTPALREGEILLETALAWDRTLWVDARPHKEYEQDHVPDALPLNEDDWDELLPALLQRWEPGTPIIVYCSSLSCRASHAVAERIRQEVGLDPVYVLQGGWEAWLKANG